MEEVPKANKAKKTKPPCGDFVQRLFSLSCLLSRLLSDLLDCLLCYLLDCLLCCLLLHCHRIVLIKLV